MGDPQTASRAETLAFGLFLRFLRRSGWQGVDDFARPGVVKFFSGLMFNCIRIVLQSIHMTLQKLVFALQAFKLNL